MDELIALIKVMRVGEKRMLKHMLSRTTNAEDNLRLKLFDLLATGNSCSESDVKKQLGSSSSSSFSHLKSRLKEDILSVLLVKESSKRIAQSNRAAQFECQKKIAQAYVLIFRGAKQEGANILKSAKSLAVKYELAAELVSINHITREALYSFSNGKGLNEVNKSLQNDLQVWSDILRAEELSFYLTLPQLKKELEQTKEEGFETRMIDELKTLYEKSGTARIGFWYYMAATEYHSERKEFNQVLEFGLKFLSLVERSPAVKSKNNMAGVNQTVGFAQIELRNFGQAISHLMVSEKLFPVSGFNRLQCLQLLALSEIALKDYDSAFATVEKALMHSKISAREHFLPRWLFIKSCVQFLVYDMDASFKTLNQNGYLLKQQDEWNVQFRLLEMMLLIEKRDEEWLEFKLDATRKFLNRYKTLDTPRVRVVVDVISNLLRKDLSFEKISEKNLLLLKLCEDEAVGYEWNPSGSEFVRFEYWVRTRLG